MRHRRKWTQLAAVGVVAGLAGFVGPALTPATARANPPGHISTPPGTALDIPGATATAHAVRLNPPTSNGSTCTSVNVIGDSMLAASINTWRDTFDNAGVTANFYAFSGAQAGVSGPSFVDQLRTSRGDAPCWIVVMGANDIKHVWEIDPTVNTGEVCNSSAARRAEADGRINLVNAAIGDHHRIFWVNVYVGTQADGTCIWNGQLNRMNIGVIDWYGSSLRHPEWFLDGVHTTPAGDAARANLAVDAVA